MEMQRSKATTKRQRAKQTPQTVTHCQFKTTAFEAKRGFQLKTEGFCGESCKLDQLCLKQKQFKLLIIVLLHCFPSKMHLNEVGLKMSQKYDNVEV